jgi:hypothetical protein
MGRGFAKNGGLWGESQASTYQFLREVNAIFCIQNLFVNTFKGYYHGASYLTVTYFAYKI